MAFQQIGPYSTCERRRYDYILDEDQDLASLPEICAPGSTALSCASGTLFVLNASGEWVALGGE